MDRLRGKIALVTGGARSLGKAQCMLFAAEGAKIIVTDILVREGEERRRSSSTMFRMRKTGKG